MLLYLVIGLVVEWGAYQIMGITGVLIGYLLLGLAWHRIYWLGKPLTHRGLGPPIWLILVWPYASLLALRERSLLLKHPQRFTVLYGDTGESTVVRTPYQISFGSWDKALEFAKLEATKSGHEVTVRDMAEYGKSPMTGEPTTARHAVLPSGEVKRLI